MFPCDATVSKKTTTVQLLQETAAMKRSIVSTPSRRRIQTYQRETKFNNLNKTEAGPKDKFDDDIEVDRKSI